MFDKRAVSGGIDCGRNGSRLRCEGRIDGARVKEKKVTFDLNEWAEVERRAAVCHTKTGTYIKFDVDTLRERIRVSGKK